MNTLMFFFWWKKSNDNPGHVNRMLSQYSDTVSMSFQLKAGSVQLWMNICWQYSNNLPFDLNALRSSEFSSIANFNLKNAPFWNLSIFYPTAFPDADDILFPEPNAHGNGQSNRQQLTDSYEYIPYNNVPMGASRYGDRIFVTVPRRRPGVPSTLNVISTKSTKGSSPSYKPFPNVETNRLHVNILFHIDWIFFCKIPKKNRNDCTIFAFQRNLQSDPNRIISVYRTRVDDCNRLWWIDTGKFTLIN